MNNLKELVDKIKNHKDHSPESINNLILSLGLNNEIINEQPMELKEYFGKGLRIWQYPNQLSKFASIISSLKVNSYMEIGVRHGGTFIFNSEILLKNNPDIKLYACDVIPESLNLQEYHKIQNFTYIQASSSSAEFINFIRKNPIDFIFIDGDHCYNAVKADFDLFANFHNSRYIVLHDVCNDACPDVKRLWSEVKNNDKFNTIEFCDQYDSVNGNFLGIGIAVRK